MNHNDKLQFSLGLSGTSSDLQKVTEEESDDAVSFLCLPSSKYSEQKVRAKLESSIIVPELSTCHLKACIVFRADQANLPKKSCYQLLDKWSVLVAGADVDSLCSTQYEFYSMLKITYERNVTHNSVIYFTLN